MTNNIIKKVNTGPPFKLDYVQIDGSIYHKDYAISLYPNLKEEIINIAKSEPSKDLEKTYFTIFPKNNAMVVKLKNKAKEIFKELNLNKIQGKNSDIKKAMLIFDYLSKNSTYDMTSMEETARRIKLNDLIEEHQDEQELAKNIVNGYNRMVLKHIYNSLIHKKGVCEEFSYTYQYLLNELNIKCLYVATINKKENLNNDGFIDSHAFNLVEFIENEKKQLLIADVTTGVALANVSRPTLENRSFGVDKLDFIDNKGDMICSVQKMYPLKENAVDIFREIEENPNIISKIEKKITTSKNLEKIIKEVSDFINNGYETTEDDENLVY